MQLICITLAAVLILLISQGEAMIRGATRQSVRLSCLRKGVLRMCWNERVNPVDVGGDKLKPGMDGSPGRDSFHWKTPFSTIEALELEMISVKPELITFDCFGTLMYPSQSVGRWYRQALNEQCDMRIRLPRPALFTAAFDKAYNDMLAKHPSFGASTGMGCRDWWYAVVEDTYRSTSDLSNTIDASELTILIPRTFDFLYDEIFSTSEGWLLKDEAVYTLEKLAEWRDQGGGPKLGVISNFDDRLPSLLRTMGILEFFNRELVLDSYSQAADKPDRKMFDLAAATAGADASKCFHIGDSISKDVNGAVGAGWTAMRYNEWFDEDLPDWSAIESEEEAESGQMKRQQLMHWGRKDSSTGVKWYELWGLDDILTLFGFPVDESKAIRTTYVRNYREDF